MELSQHEFENLREYFKEAIGFSLGNEKVYLVKQRVQPLVEHYGCSSYTEFYQMLVKGTDLHLKNKIIAAITTNETSFFRDLHPFEAFRTEIFPELCHLVRERKMQRFTRRGPKCRIWCAAASTGQEPYSLAMVIDDTLARQSQRGVVNEDFSILASDISSEVLSKAMAGRYNNLDISRGLPKNYKERYFIREDNTWGIKEDIQRMVEFKRINLVEPFMFAGSFDVIFCRNALIYFDIDTRTKIIQQFHQLMNKGGYLVLGASENTYGISVPLESRHIGQTIAFQKNT